MKKTKLKILLEVIEKDILEYFSVEGRFLKILDHDTRTKLLIPYTYSQKGYTGVTDKYLARYLFFNKYRVDLIRYILLKLLKERKIRTIICPNINKVVFEPLTGAHGSKYFINKTNYYENSIEDYPIYRRYVKNYFVIDSYISRSNKFENSDS